MGEVGRFGQRVQSFICSEGKSSGDLVYSTIKSLLRKVKEESIKAALKLNGQKTKIMASGPIISWQIDRETMETTRDFIFLGSKISGDGDCRHEIKRCLLLGRKAMTNLDSTEELMLSKCGAGEDS